LNHGFLSLVPTRTHGTVREITVQLARVASNAFVANCAARAAAMDAIDQDRIGMSEAAAIKRRQADLEHRRGCSELVDLSLLCTNLVRVCAVDFLPTHDVAGTGLDVFELSHLCSVYGTPYARMDGEFFETR
jgi:hypothetical protein